VTLLFTNLSIAFSNQRFSSASRVCRGCAKLTPRSFCGNGIFRASIKSSVIRAAVVLLFLTQSVSVYKDLFLSVDVRQLMLSFPRFVYADITIETVAPDAPYNVTVPVRNCRSRCAL
jgi:hypothetical protein